MTARAATHTFFLGLRKFSEKTIAKPRHVIAKTNGNQRMTHCLNLAALPFIPTSADRHRVQLAVAIGLTLPETAGILGISRSLLSKLFVTEIANARAKCRLENACRLDKAAARGNVAAAKALMTLMADPAAVSAAVAEPDQWAKLLAEYGVPDDDNSGRFSNFEKGH